ncbi:hypothetical protein AAH979_39850 [Plantactinospora sp. ZYX-F-223]|uniref:hypothetical protein n=1 Tax=Plantactinospora sp. ZYX-F-223 TaxID=3144103 RepID=UPI0031FBAB4E
MQISGALVAAAGLAWFTQLSPDGTVWGDVIAPSAVVSIGFAVMIVPTTIAALTDVPESHSGVASALLNVSMQVGGALGLAVLSAAATARTLDQSRAGVPAGLSLVEGFGVAFAIAAGLMAVAAILALVFFREQGRRQRINLVELQNGSFDD